MEDMLYYNNLYDLYGSLLTERQREYFEDYYFNNLTLSEMSENYGVSRNAISKQLHIVTEKLVEYERKLKLNEKKERLLNLIENINDRDIKSKIEDLIN